MSIMTGNNHSEHILNVINKTFEVLYNVYSYHKEGNGFTPLDCSRIIFPQKRKKDTRVSEQELRFMFVEQLNDYISKHKEWSVYYSIETPSKDTYCFKEKIPTRKKEEDGGRSANFDLVIHNDKGERIALIEFKANNPRIKDYHKDFVKLSNENETGELRFFIHLLENTDVDTFSSIHGKIINNETLKCIFGKKEVHYLYFSLEKGKSAFLPTDIKEEILFKDIAGKPSQKAL